MAIAAGLSVVVADSAGAVQGVATSAVVGVKVPKVPVPVPTVPAVPAPTVPPVSVPTPTYHVPTPVPVPKPTVPPASPHVPTVQGLGGTGSTTPSGGGGSAPVVTGSAPSSGGYSTGTTTTSTTAGTAISQGVPGTAPHTATPEQRRAERRKERRQGRHVRHALRRLGSCLTELPRDQRRVLVLRAAFGKSHPRTRAQVARRLDMSQRRVRRLERRGLRRLHAEDRSAGCAPLDLTSLDGTSGSERALAGASVEHTLLTGATLAGGTAGSSGGSGGGGKAQSGVRGESRSSNGGGVGPATVRVPELTPPGETQGGTDVVLALLLLGVAAAALVVRQRLRSQDRADAS